MFSFKISPFITPWRVLRGTMFAIGLAALAVYLKTMVGNVYPGESARYVAAAMGLNRGSDLTYPIFSFFSRTVAMLPNRGLFAHQELLTHLHSFNALCAASAVALLFLVTARLVLLLIGESPGESPVPLMPGVYQEKDKSHFYEISPEAALDHNWLVMRKIIVGGLIAAVTLAFAAPFWFVATRLYPYAFDLMLLLFIIKLLLDYAQRGHCFVIYPTTFLLFASGAESIHFLLLLVVGCIVILRYMMVYEHFKARNVVALFFVAVIGMVVAWWLVWQRALEIEFKEANNLVALLKLWVGTVADEFLDFVPGLNWSYVLVQSLLPISLAGFAFSISRRRYRLNVLVAQIAVLCALIPLLLHFNLQNPHRGESNIFVWLLRFFRLDMSLWHLAAANNYIPIFQYLAVAFVVGIMVTVWRQMVEHDTNLGKENFDSAVKPLQDKICRVAARFCWPLLVVILALAPIINGQNIDRRAGSFADQIAKTLLDNLGSRDWLINCGWLQDHLRLAALWEEREISFLEIESEAEVGSQRNLVALIKATPEFALRRNRLINAAEIAPTAFLRELLNSDNSEYRRFAFFNVPELLRTQGFEVVPAGLFLECLPQEKVPDARSFLAGHKAYVDRIVPLLKSRGKGEDIGSVRLLRRGVQLQTALVANELAVLLYKQGYVEEATTLLQQTDELLPGNLSVALNHYFLMVKGSSSESAVAEKEAYLQRFARRNELNPIILAWLQHSEGTLINPGTLEMVRNKVWSHSVILSSLLQTPRPHRLDPVAELQIRKHELEQNINRLINVNAPEANSNLGLLLEIEPENSAALLSKAQIAIQHNRLDEAATWMQRARECGAGDEELVWHTAAIVWAKGDVVKARKLVEEAIATHYSDIRLWGLLAKMMAMNGEFAELSSRVYPVIHSLSNRSEHYLTFMVRGYLLKHNGPQDYIIARSSFKRALSLNGGLTFLEEEILLLDDALDVPAFSEVDAKRVLLHSPEHAFANALWGMVRLRRGEVDLAEDLLQRSLAVERSAIAVAGLGGVLLARGEYQEAEKLLREALALDPERVYTHYALARILMATERLDEAEAELKFVLQKRPKEYEVRLAKVRLSIQRKEYVEAAQLLSALQNEEDNLTISQLEELEELVSALSSVLRF